MAQDDEVRRGGPDRPKPASAASAQRGNRKPAGGRATGTRGANGAVVGGSRDGGGRGRAGGRGNGRSASGGPANEDRPRPVREDRSGRARRAAGPAPARLTDEQRAEIAARYDPRREKRRQEARVPLPDDVEPQMLDPEVRTELRSLAKDTADLVARHLVLAGRLVDEDPQQALSHARAARAMAGRVGAVREAAGLTAYLAGEWADALSELRAARRITGRADHLPVLADCERALGRPEKALAYADDPAVGTIDQEIRVELVIVVAGARRDLGQPDAAVLTLQDPARRTTAKRPWAARLWYAYADALLDAGRADEARDWFSRVAQVDAEGDTDAADRLLELDGIVLDDLDPDGSDAGSPPPGDN